MIQIGRVEIPEGIDYYVVYNLNKDAKTEELYKDLKSKNAEIISYMSGASLNEEMVQALQKRKVEIEPAIKIFKKEELREKYDKYLANAYAEGKIDTRAQELAKELYEKILSMVINGNYSGAVRACLDAINDNVRDERIYILLAQSYFAQDEIDESFGAVSSGLRACPESIPIMQTGARLSLEAKGDAEGAQNYIDKMMKIDPESGLAHVEQSHLYLSLDNEEMAYKTIDQYMERHPGDEEFRQLSAYDLVTHSYSFYEKDNDSGDYVIASRENYEKCLETCTKAASLHNDETVQSALDDAKYFGTVQFNYENRESIFFLIGGGIAYLFPVITIPIGLLLLFSAWRLWKLSHRPYWQIYKFEMTGKREKGELKYILIGKIFTGYIKICFKIVWGIFKMILYMISRS